MIEKSKVVISSAILCMAIYFLCCQGQLISIQELKGEKWEQYVGKTITIEGIFVKDPLPILVTDLELVLANVPLPYDQYLLLSGDVISEIDPSNYGGAKISVSGMLKEVKVKHNQLTTEKVILEVKRFKILQMPEIIYAPQIQSKIMDFNLVY